MATTDSPQIVSRKSSKKEIEVIKVLAEKVTGRVKWYNTLKGYGFISRSDDGGDLFVHRSVISAYSKPHPSLKDGEEVEFSVVETNQGIEANMVTGPGGQPVKGGKFSARRFRTVSEPADAKRALNEQNQDGSRPKTVNRSFRGRGRRGRNTAAKSDTVQNDDSHGEKTNPCDPEPCELVEKCDNKNKSDEVNGSRQHRRNYRGARHRSESNGLGPSNEIEENRNFQNNSRYRRPHYYRPMGNSRYTNDYYYNRGSFSQIRNRTPNSSNYYEKQRQNGDISQMERGYRPYRKRTGNGMYPRRSSRRPPSEGGLSEKTEFNHVTNQGEQKSDVLNSELKSEEHNSEKNSTEETTNKSVLDTNDQ